MGGKAYIGGTAHELKPGKVLINGTAHNISQGKTKIGGTTYNINFGIPKNTTFEWLSPTVEDWVCPATGKYQCEIHGGGGGGGGDTSTYTADESGYGGASVTGAGGGGSGSLKTISLVKGQTYVITVGKGGTGASSTRRFVASRLTSSYTHGTAGNPSSITIKSSGSNIISVNGGGYSSVQSIGGTHAGDISTDGQGGYGGYSASGGSGEIKYGDSSGGLGNEKQPTQKYGNGAYGKCDGHSTSIEVPNGSESKADDGYDGAIILTYLGT